MRTLNVPNLVDIVQVEGPRGSVGITVAEVDAGLLQPVDSYLKGEKWSRILAIVFV